MKTDTARLRRWLWCAWQATHKGTQDAAEFARDRCRRDGQVVCLDQTACRVRTASAPATALCFPVVAIQFLVSGEDGWHPDVGQFFGLRHWVKVRSVAVAWCSHGSVSFPTLTHPISFGWIGTLYATSEIPGWPARRTETSVASNPRSLRSRRLTLFIAGRPGFASSPQSPVRSRIARGGVIFGKDGSTEP